MFGEISQHNINKNSNGETPQTRFMFDLKNNDNLPNNVVNKTLKLKIRRSMSEKMRRDSF
jgi:hypothetical protein